MKNLFKKVGSRINGEQSYLEIYNIVEKKLPPYYKDQVFQKILEQGNHEEIMALLDYPQGICLNEESSLKLIARGDHEEIMLAIKKRCFTDAEGYINGFRKVIERGNHEEIMAFLDYPQGICLNEESSLKLIARGNHEEIMMAIKKRRFTDAEGYIYGFRKVIERGNHEEIMAFLDYPQGMCLNEESSLKLIARGDHEEIMLAIKKRCFTDAEGYIHGLWKVIERGNHEEIMAFLDYPQGIYLTEESSVKLITRGNLEEIKFATEKNILFRVTPEPEPERDPESVAYAAMSFMDLPYHYDWSQD